VPGLVEDGRERVSGEGRVKSEQVTYTLPSG
jgi:hypothetical protein